MSREGAIEDAGARGMELLGVAVVHGGRGLQPDPGMTMSVVVPTNERPAVLAGVLDGVEPGGEPGPVLSVLKLASEYGLSEEV